MKSTLLMAAIATGLLVTAADAQAFGRDHGGRGGPGGFGNMPSFSELDTNGDGQLSMEELTPDPGARFAEADTNGDGGLSVEEMVAHAVEQARERAGDKAAERLEDLDENGDGLLQLEEMQSGRRGNPERMMERMFEHLDENEDGMISEEEFEAAKEGMGQGRRRN